MRLEPYRIANAHNILKIRYKTGRNKKQDQLADAEKMKHEKNQKKRHPILSSPLMLFLHTHPLSLL